MVKVLIEDQRLGLRGSLGGRTQGQVLLIRVYVISLAKRALMPRKVKRALGKVHCLVAIIQIVHQSPIPTQKLVLPGERGLEVPMTG